MVQEYLGGPSSFTTFMRELGDSRMPLHGVIGVVVFVRTAHVETGAFEIHHGAVDKVAAGVSTDIEELIGTDSVIALAEGATAFVYCVYVQVNLGPMGRAPNKGMVGISVRYFDCSLALMNAHFAADLKGRARVERRNQVSLRQMAFTMSFRCCMAVSVVGLRLIVDRWLAYSSGRMLVRH